LSKTLLLAPYPIAINTTIYFDAFLFPWIFITHNQQCTFLGFSLDPRKINIKMQKSSINIFIILIGVSPWHKHGQYKDIYLRVKMTILT
jgi:hypothetical protein